MSEQELIAKWEARAQSARMASLGDFIPSGATQEADAYDRCAGDLAALVAERQTPQAEQGWQPSEREAFKAGFLAVHTNTGPPWYQRIWTFDGVAAADLEPEAWAAWETKRGPLPAAPTGQDGGPR